MPNSLPCVRRGHAHTTSLRRCFLQSPRRLVSGFHEPNAFRKEYPKRYEKDRLNPKRQSGLTVGWQTPSRPLSDVWPIPSMGCAR